MGSQLDRTDGLQLGPSSRVRIYGSKTGTSDSIAFVYNTHAEVDRAEAAVREAVKTAADISIG